MALHVVVLGAVHQGSPALPLGQLSWGHELLSKHISKHSVRASSSQEQRYKASQPAGLHRAVHRNAHRV